MAGDAAEIENLRLDLFGRNSGSLLRHGVLDGRLAVVETQVTEIGTGVIPQFLVDDEKVLPAGLRNMHLADVSEIGNRRLRPAGQSANMQKQQGFVILMRWRIPFCAGARSRLAESCSQSRW